MPRLVINALSPGRVKHETRPGSYADGDGLYLLVTKTGGRYWIWRGTVKGTRQELGIGPVRLVSLADARQVAKDWRNIARAGGDPKAERDKAKRKRVTFAEAMTKVHGEQVEPQAKNPKAARYWLASLRDYAVPVIGNMPVDSITTSDILRVLAPIWTEKPETARRVRQRIRTVLDWATTAGHREGVNPVEGVGKGLPRQRDRVQHHTALPYAELPDLMQRLEAEDGIAALALRFLILTAARSLEARAATWPEIDLEGRVWRIPPERMKAGDEHKVPLSDAALGVLERVQGLDTTLVFPSRKPGVPVQATTLKKVLVRLDVPVVTVHGFRSSFRDWAEEWTRYSYETKERALAHAVKNPVERAYRRGDLFDQRRALMDDWARFATSASREGKVVELRG